MTVRSYKIYMNSGACVPFTSKEDMGYYKNLIADNPDWIAFGSGAIVRKDAIDVIVFDGYISVQS